MTNELMSITAEGYQEQIDERSQAYEDFIAS